MERSASADRRAQRQRRQQVLETARSHKPTLSYQEKGALVDKLVELSWFHRKSELRLLRQQPADHGDHSGLLQSVSQPVWPEQVACALLGEIATFLCSNPLLPQPILT